MNLPDTFIGASGHFDDPRDYCEDCTKPITECDCPDINLCVFCGRPAHDDLYCSRLCAIAAEQS